MFAGRFSSSTGYVGVDFGLHGVKLLQLREHQKKLDVIGAAYMPRPRVPEGTETDRNALVDQLRAAVAAGRFAGKQCVVNLPRRDVHVQSIRLPQMPDDELRQAAGWEAAQRFGLDRESMQVDFIRTGATLQNSESREEVLVVAASHAAINACLEPLMEADLRPVAVDAGFTALARVFSQRARREADEEAVRAIVDVGASGSTVIILRGQEIAFCKPLSLSGNDLTSAVAEHLQMDEQSAAELRAARINHAHGSGNSNGNGAKQDPATDRAVFDAVRPLIGELIKEISLCVRYYGVTFRGRPPMQLILTGGDALEPRLDELVAEACRIPVQHEDPPGIVSDLLPKIHNALNRSAGPAASWAVAAGLSTRDLFSATKAARLRERLARAQRGAA